jgi:hypothetical protein
LGVVAEAVWANRRFGFIYDIIHLVAVLQMIMLSEERQENHICGMEAGVK